MTAYFIKQPSVIQRGFSLIEVLIALLILSIGLLGIAGLQGASLGKTRESSLRTQAMIMAQDLIDSMRSNPDPDARDIYAIATNQTPSTGKDCLAVNCSPTDLAEFQLDQWWNQIDRSSGKSRFPNGQVAVTVESRNDGKSSLVKVAISWDEINDAKVETVTFRLNSLI